MQANWRPSRSVTLPAHAERKTGCVCSVYLPQIPAEVHALSGAGVLAQECGSRVSLMSRPRGIAFCQFASEACLCHPWPGACMRHCPICAMCVIVTGF